jgi:hypothetical protein
VAAVTVTATETPPRDAADAAADQHGSCLVGQQVHVPKKSIVAVVFVDCVTFAGLSCFFVAEQAIVAKRTLLSQMKVVVDVDVVVVARTLARRVGEGPEL